MELNWKTPFTIRKRGIFTSYVVLFENDPLIEVSSKELAELLVRISNGAYNLGYSGAMLDTHSYPEQNHKLAS